MKRPDIKARREYQDIVSDIPTRVTIPGTRRTVSLRGVKPYTLERLTRLWQKREIAAGDDSASVLRSMCAEPYFAVREAVLFTLNSYWKIRLLYRLKSWWWGKVRGYTDSQMLPIIQEGKKKLQLTAHWTVMAYSTDMRSDLMKMTKKEAEQFQAELLSAAKLLSSRSSRATGAQDGSSSGS